MEKLCLHIYVLDLIFYVPEGDLMQLTDVARFLISSAVSLHCTPPPPPKERIP